MFKLAIAFGLGYVLGARAGRDRYEQIVALASQLSGSGGSRPQPLRDERGRFVAQSDGLR